MKIAKLIGAIVFSLIAVILIVGLLAPQKVTMTASQIIAAPDSIVFKQVNILKNWEKWSPFLEADPTMESQYHGPDAGVGSQMLWRSSKQVDGMATLTRSIPNKRIVFVLSYMRQGSATSDWGFQPMGDSVKVTWTTTVTNLSYPIGRIMGLFMNRMMQKFYQKGFNNLALVCREEMRKKNVKQEPQASQE